MNGITALLARLGFGLGAIGLPCLAMAAVPGDPLAQSCQSCHSPDVDAPAMPDLSNHAPQDIAKALRAARDQPAPGSIMGRFARGLSDEDIQALSVAFQPQAPR